MIDDDTQNDEETPIDPVDDPDVHNDGSLDGRIAPRQTGEREPADLDKLIEEEEEDRLTKLRKRGLI